MAAILNGAHSTTSTVVHVGSVHNLFTFHPNPSTGSSDILLTDETHEQRRCRSGGGRRAAAARLLRIKHVGRCLLSAASRLPGSSPPRMRAPRAHFTVKRWNRPRCCRAPRRSCLTVSTRPGAAATSVWTGGGCSPRAPSDAIFRPVAARRSERASGSLINRCATGHEARAERPWRRNETSWSRWGGRRWTCPCSAHEPNVPTYSSCEGGGGPVGVAGQARKIQMRGSVQVEAPPPTDSAVHLCRMRINKNNKNKN